MVASTSVVRDVIWNTASAKGIDDGLIWVVLTIAWGESSWIEDAGGDGGDSVGLFQINIIHDPSWATGNDPRKGAQWNANWIMPQMKTFIDRGVARGLNGEALLKYVWYNVEKPYGYKSSYSLGYDPNTTDPAALAGLANMESAFRDASSGSIDVRDTTNGEVRPHDYHGLGDATTTSGDGVLP